MSKPVSSRTDQIHSPVRDRFSRPTSLERRRLVRGKASADGRQLAKAGPHREVTEKPTVKPVEVRQSEKYLSKLSATRRPLKLCRSPIRKKNSFNSNRQKPHRDHADR